MCSYLTENVDPNYIPSFVKNCDFEKKTVKCRGPFPLCLHNWKSSPVSAQSLVRAAGIRAYQLERRNPLKESSPSRSKQHVRFVRPFVNIQKTAQLLLGASCPSTGKLVATSTLTAYLACTLRLRYQVPKINTASAEQLCRAMLPLPLAYKNPYHL